MAAPRSRSTSGRCFDRLRHHEQHWWLVPVVVLLPDIAMTGYVGGTRVGAFVYNIAHATPVPALIILVGWSQHRPLTIGLGLVWLAHIALDRLMGYGLKYDDHFQHAHLGMLGGKERVSRAGFTTTRGRIARQPRSS